MQLRDITFYSPDAPSTVDPNADKSMGSVSSATAHLGDISWSDVLDTLNPLEHIPVVSTVYNAITGSKPSAGAQMAGGVLYGGPLGLVASAVSLAFQGETGHDVPGSVYAAVTGGNTSQYAKNTASETIQTADASAINATALPTDTAVDAVVQTPVAEILPPDSTAKTAMLGAGATNQQQRSQDVLSLFDAPNAAAHSAYRRTQSLTAPTTSGASMTM